MFGTERRVCLHCRCAPIRKPDHPYLFTHVVIEKKKTSLALALLFNILAAGSIRNKMAGMRGREGGFPPRDEHPREKAMRSIFGEYLD